LMSSQTLQIALNQPIFKLVDLRGRYPKLYRNVQYFLRGGIPVEKSSEPGHLQDEAREGES
jgi:hypothetical protein